MMMLELDIEAVTDLSLSSSNHTLGDAQTHDYIPGRTLWGALASHAYRSGMAEDEAFRLFHQGAVRILDAVPATGSARTYPAPGCWHRPKESDAGVLHNFVLESVRDKCKTQQCKPLKQGWFTPAGERLELERAYSLRTAVDPSGKARDGLLYGLPVLRAGSTFWCAIVGEEKDIDKLRPLLKRDLRVGRSRNAELGVVRISIRKAPIQKLDPGQGKATQLSFLCVSRCIFRDPASGSPVLEPPPTAFGLPGDWTLELSSSFLRTARIVHFNSKRGRPERERFALERGSVLTYRGTNPIELHQVSSFTALGVGEDCGHGYGEVLVAPNWLVEPERQVTEAATRTTSQAGEPKDELFQWARAQASKRRRAIELSEKAADAARALRSSRVPSSQWGALRAMAREARFTGATDLYERLFRRGDAGQKSDGFLTSGKRKLSKAWKSAEPKLRTACDEHRDDLPTFLELLASACMRPDGSARKGGNDNER